MALSDTKLRSISDKPYRGKPELTDSDGLSARISPNGVVAFQYRYRWEGKPVRLTIGHYPSLSLKDARIIVSDMRNLYKKGLNPKIYFSKDEGEATLKDCLDYWWDKYASTLKKIHKYFIVQLCITPCIYSFSLYLLQIYLYLHG